MKKNVVTSANKVKRKKKIKKILKIILLILILLLLILYIIFGIIYNRGSFTILMDKDLYLKNGIIIYDDPDYKVYRTELSVETLPYMDNISGWWLPDDLDKNEGGGHNGNNYVAYTFYIENLGNNVTDYWTEIIIDDVIKNVDEVVRIRIYKNDEVATYAKISSEGEPEKDTVPFISDTLVARDHIEEFKPGDRNKYTIVFWLEGSDPECTDNILGGEIKLHMDFKSEVIIK